MVKIVIVSGEKERGMIEDKIKMMGGGGSNKSSQTNGTQIIIYKKDTYRSLADVSMSDDMVRVDLRMKKDVWLRLHKLIQQGI